MSYFFLLFYGPDYVAPPTGGGGVGALFIGALELAIGTDFLAVGN